MIEMTTLIFIKLFDDFVGHVKKRIIKIAMSVIGQKIGITSNDM
jgi:hypothetical protein